MSTFQSLRVGSEELEFPENLEDRPLVILYEALDVVKGMSVCQRMEVTNSDTHTLLNTSHHSTEN